MSTVVTAAMVRSFNAGMFADLTEATPTGQIKNRVMVLTFDDDLDAPTVRLIVARMLSRNDDDSDGAALLDDRDALAAGTPLRRFYDYVLGLSE